MPNLFSRNRGFLLFKDRCKNGALTHSHSWLTVRGMTLSPASWKSSTVDAESSTASVEAVLAPRSAALFYLRQETLKNPEVQSFSVRSLKKNRCPRSQMTTG